MVKYHIFYIGGALKNVVNKPVRDKYDLLILLLKTIQELLTPNSDTVNVLRISEKEKDVFKIIESENGKMKRIFYYNKYEEADMYTIQSCSFPFDIYKEDDNFIIQYTSRGKKLKFDSGAVSKIISIINIMNSEEVAWGDAWMHQMLEIFYGDNILEEINSNELFYIINDFLICDLGYVRFDKDPKHEEENHPLNHLDINMNNYSTYKIGLKNSLDIDSFSRIINNEFPVWFLRE